MKRSEARLYGLVDTVLEIQPTEKKVKFVEVAVYKHLILVRQAIITENTALYDFLCNYAEVVKNNRSSEYINITDKLHIIASYRNKVQNLLTNAVHKNATHQERLSALYSVLNDLDSVSAQ